jgi:hypothetical protein
MTPVQIVLNILAYAIFTLAPMIAWPGRFNVAWTTQAAFFMTAYLLPLALLDFDLFSDRITIENLTLLNSIGAISIVVGIFIGKSISSKKPAPIDFYPDLRFIARNPLAEKRVAAVLTIGALGMTLCFAWMGMVPALADDPFSAKFFKGPYKEKYDQVAIIYRLSQFAVITVLPLAMAYGIERRRPATIATAVFAMSILAVSLTRAPVLEGAVLIAAIKMAESRNRFLIFIIGSILIYILGSAIYALIGLTQSEESFLQEAAAGAPDILDHLSFLGQFDLQKNITYGMTFIGGLIPGNFEFNPAVFSLAISNPFTDPADSPSGGFRMPPSIWGFTAFGYYGASIVCLISGIFIGRSTKLLKKIKTARTLREKVAIALWFKIIILFIANFYAMFYFGVLSIIIFIYLTQRYPIKSRINSKIHNPNNMRQNSPHAVQ